MEGARTRRSTMKRLKLAVLAVMAVVAGAFAAIHLSAQLANRLDAEAIGQASGVKPTTAPDGVVRIAWPRTDVAVTVDGMPLKPFAGLGSWAAFTPGKDGAMVMGDTVVFQDEVGP